MNGEVYVVTAGYYEETSINAVFTEQSAAEAYCAAMNAEISNMGYTWEAVDLNPPIPSLHKSPTPEEIAAQQQAEAQRRLAAETYENFRQQQLEKWRAQERKAGRMK